MKPDIYKLIEVCVETGVTYGLARAYKHNDTPTPEQIQENIRREVMREICEWFKFDPIKDTGEE